MLCIDESLLQTDLERQLWAEVQRLTSEVAELRVLLAKALKNSSTSSKPPSSDIVKPPKPPASTPDKKRKRGGQPGHAKHSRLPFDAASVTTAHTYTLMACPDCRSKMKLLKSGNRSSRRSARRSSLGRCPTYCQAFAGIRRGLLRVHHHANA